MPDAGNVAIVSYITGPLGRFLDSLRRELTPDSRPRAHVTVLPPRPVPPCLGATLQRVVELDCEGFCAFEVELDVVGVFPVSNVVYVDVVRGGPEMRRLHDRLNRGMLEYQCGYPYQPHTTLAQGLSPEDACIALPRALRAWRQYTGPKRFVVDTISVVRQLGPEDWGDMARVALEPGDELMAVSSRTAPHTSTL
jgi:2'-5' RNA ligase